MFDLLSVWTPELIAEFEQASSSSETEKEDQEVKAKLSALGDTLAAIVEFRDKVRTFAIASQNSEI